MLNHLLDKRRNVFILAAFAVFMESLTSPCLKIGSQRYDTFSAGYFFWFGLAVIILGIYAVCWQLILERIPLTTAYLRRGFSYILLFVWSTLIFHENITVKQVIGIAVISLGMFISVSGDSSAPEKSSGSNGSGSCSSNAAGTSTDPGASYAAGTSTDPGSSYAAGTSTDPSASYAAGTSTDPGSSGIPDT